VGLSEFVLGKTPNKNNSLARDLKASQAIGKTNSKLLVVLKAGDMFFHYPSPPVAYIRIPNERFHLPGLLGGLGEYKVFCFYSAPKEEI
jgi:hypothetical protein